MKHNIKRIAITGGIGSGKSFICEIIKELGEACLSCDEISKELWKNPEYQNELARLFPNACEFEKIDKKLLSNLVFNNPNELKKLNNFSHPKIMDRLFLEIEGGDRSPIYAEVPLLFEGGYEDYFDKIIVVMREKSQRITSIIKRDNCTREMVERKMAAQFDYDAADFSNPKYIIVKNNLCYNQLKENIQKIIQQK